MAFTASNFQELLMLLDEHPEWRAELRRQLLTEELLQLPSLVHEQAEHLAAIDARLETLTVRLDLLTARVDVLTERVDRLTERMDQLTVQMGGLADRVGRMDGQLLELRYARLAPAYFSRLARRLKVIDPGDLANLLDDAVDARTLSGGEREAVLLADLVLSGRLREDQANVYLLAEVSVGIGPGDVRRAAERAAILRKLGQRVIPLVAGLSITPDAETLAAALDVRSVLTRPDSVSEAV